MIDEQFWVGKRVLITGNTGFKGSWLSLWLHDLGADVTGYSLEPPTHPSMYDVCNLSAIVTQFTGDIRDYGMLQDVIQKTDPQIIFHMAAQPLVRQSYRDPVETYSTNVMGTVHLLEAVRGLKQPRTIINVTSDKCYENREWFWGYRENDPLGGHDPYSNSKACAELVTSSFQSSFFQPAHYAVHHVGLASVRAGNVIGGGDWADERLVPDVIRSIKNEEIVTLRNPKAVRPWQHVLEPLSGYLMLAQKLLQDGERYASAWNFGPSDADAKTVEWIVQQLYQRWGVSPNYEVIPNAGLHEAGYLKLDCTKAHAELAWKPSWNATMAIVKTVDWFKALLDGKDMLALSREQIIEYSRCMNG